MLAHPVIPFVTEELWAPRARRRRAAGRAARARAATRRCATPRPSATSRGHRHRPGRALVARRRRRQAGRVPGGAPRRPRRPRAARRAARAPDAGRRRRPRAGRRRSRSAACRSSCSPASTPRRPRAKVEAERKQLRGRSRAPRASWPTRASWPRRPRPSWPPSATKLERLQRGAGGARAWRCDALEDAERLLLSLELFGMRFGLDRMRRLLTALGSPQERFARDPRRRHQRQVLDGAHDRGDPAPPRPAHRRLPLAAPRLVRRARARRRRRRSGAELRRRGRSARRAPPRRSTARCAARRPRHAVRAADRRRLRPLRARRRRRRASSRPGLGGRYDATNVLPLARRGAHQRRRWSTRAGWARRSPTSRARSSPSCAHGATLVVGADLHPDARALAERTARERDARLVVAPRRSRRRRWRSSPAGAFQRRNFALARRGRARVPRRRSTPTAVARPRRPRRSCPGRFEVVAEQPPTTVLDGAHNPGGLAALAEALHGASSPAAGSSPASRCSTTRTRAEMLRALLPLCDAVVSRARQTPRALPPATLASLVPPARLRRHRRGRGRAARRAGARPRRWPGADGVALATGSIYLIADLLRPAGAAAEHAADDEDDGPRVGAMIAAVAIIVALVILVFFGIGYGFGRLFL